MMAVVEELALVGASAGEIHEETTNVRRGLDKVASPEVVGLILGELLISDGKTPRSGLLGDIAL